MSKKVELEKVSESLKDILGLMQLQFLILEAFIKKQGYTFSVENVKDKPEQYDVKFSKIKKPVRKVKK